jgi:nitrite reductase/ring-hydroxylating ferredoxin subunit
VTWHVVAKVGDVRAGDVIAVSVEGVEMVLGLDGERYFALQRRCVHRGGDLADGIVSRGHVVCANHGWRFSTATGCHDQASDVCLTSFSVRVTGDQIEIDPTPRKQQ